MKISELRSLIRKHHKETFEPLSKLNKKGLMDYASKNGLISEPSVEAPVQRKVAEKPVVEKPRAEPAQPLSAKSKISFGQPDMKAVQSFSFPQKKVSEPVAKPKSRAVAEKPVAEKPKSSYAAFVSAEMKNRPAGVSAKDYMKDIGAKWRESRQ